MSTRYWPLGAARRAAVMNSHRLPQPLQVARNGHQAVAPESELAAQQQPERARRACVFALALALALARIRIRIRLGRPGLGAALPLSRSAVQARTTPATEHSSVMASAS